MGLAALGDAEAYAQCLEELEIYKLIERCPNQIPPAIFVCSLYSQGSSPVPVPEPVQTNRAASAATMASEKFTSLASHPMVIHTIWRLN